MLRILRTLAASMLFLTVTTLVAYFARYIPITDFWVMFGIGAGIFLLGVFVGYFHNYITAVPAYLVNAVSMGFWLRSWYINRGFDNSIWLMLGVAVLAVAYMLVFALPLFIPAVNRHYGVYVACFVLLSLGGYVALLVFTKTTWVSTLGYFGILQLSFILGSSFACNDWRDEQLALLVSSYSILVCGVIILLVVLGGDSCDCDCGGDCCSANDFKSPVNRNGKKSDPAFVAGAAATSVLGGNENNSNDLKF